MFDVITSARSYKQAGNSVEGRQEIARCAGAQFDPRVVRAFLNVSLGRMRLVMGPLSWLSHAPLLARFPLTPAIGTLAGVFSVVATASASGVIAKPVVVAAAPMQAAAVAPALHRPRHPIVHPTVPAVPAAVHPHVPTKPLPVAIHVRRLRPVVSKELPPTPPPITTTHVPLPVVRLGAQAAVGVAAPMLATPPPRVAVLPIPSEPTPAPATPAPAQPADPGGDPAPPAPADPGKSVPALPAPTVPTKAPTAIAPAPPAAGNAPGPGGTTTVVSVPGPNQPPSFIAGPAQVVLEDSGPSTVGSWATAISPGPADESDQSVSFTVTGDNAGLFSAQPSVASDGTLSYTPAANASGVAHLTLTATDSGGTADNGADTSPAQSFTITVAAVNDPPSFNRGPDQSVLEDSGPATVSSWATAISPGPADESGQSRLVQPRK